VYLNSLKRYKQYNIRVWKPGLSKSTIVKRLTHAQMKSTVSILKNYGIKHVVEDKGLI